MLQHRPLTVLQIIPALEAGGAERATIDIGLALQKAGHRPLVISSGGKMVAELKAKNIAHHTWPVHSKNPVTMLANATRLADFIRRERIDVVHARSRAPAWSALIACRTTGVPFVTTFHAAYKGKSPLKKTYNSIMARADRIIAISGFIAAHIQKNYGVDASRITTILRGIDYAAYNPANIAPSRLAELKRQWRVGDDDRAIIIMPGRLSPIKGHALLLDALHVVDAQNYVCIFIGPDQGRSDYRAALKKQASDLNLQKNIIWSDGVDMPAAYALADLVLSPSQVAEGFGRVPVEAQAAGVPIIATALGATAETIIDGETGWLVPPGDSAALATAIDKALAMPRVARAAMRDKAMQNAMRFSVDDMCAKTLEVYQRLTESKI